MALADEPLFVPANGSLFTEPRAFAWHLVSTRQTQFGYFDEVLARPAWKGRRVLDFGGNVGTFLGSAGNRIDHENYWCLDLKPFAFGSLLASLVLFSFRSCCSP